MPPKAKVDKEEILRAALGLVRDCGAQALNARALAARLGISTQPIFSNYGSMERLREEVIAAADTLYQSYLTREMGDGVYPPYKASGMAYLRFAREEKELFKLLFMRDRSGETISENREAVRPLIDLIRKNTGLSEQAAGLFHLEMWVYVHGIASMIATGYLEWDWDLISAMLTDEYEGMKARAVQKEG